MARFTITDSNAENCRHVGNRTNFFQVLKKNVVKELWGFEEYLSKILALVSFIHAVHIDRAQKHLKQETLEEH